MALFPVKIHQPDGGKLATPVPFHPRRVSDLSSQGTHCRLGLHFLPAEPLLSRAYVIPNS